MSGKTAAGAEPGEFEIIREVFRPLAAGEPGTFDLTDDAACLSQRDGWQTVLTADAIVAGVHFLPDDPAEDVAAKLLRVNLSDLAAMGAEARGYLITTAWPHPLDIEWIRRFGRGLAEDQKRFGVTLLGGDTVATSGPMTLSLTAIGEVPTGLALRRNGARPGDAVFVSGTIGDGAAGLKVLQGELEGMEESARNYLARRYRRPEPRLELGRRLRGIASACLDVSDGLLADFSHILEESSCSGEIRWPDVPLSAAARQWGDPTGILTGGDDYELLFTAAPQKREDVARAAAEAGVEVSEIGRVESGTGLRVRLENGDFLPIEQAGYRHF